MTEEIAIDRKEPLYEKQSIAINPSTVSKYKEVEIDYQFLIREESSISQEILREKLLELIEEEITNG